LHHIRQQRLRFVDGLGRAWLEENWRFAERDKTQLIGGQQHGQGGEWALRRLADERASGRSEYVVFKTRGSPVHGPGLVRPTRAHHEGGAATHRRSDGRRIRRWLLAAHGERER